MARSRRRRCGPVMAELHAGIAGEPVASGVNPKDGGHGLVTNKKTGLSGRFQRLFRGGEEEDRTPDLRIANATLSQLSYPPTSANYSSTTYSKSCEANARPCDGATIAECDGVGYLGDRYNC
jgi:hypothetical protein